MKHRIDARAGNGRRNWRRAMALAALAALAASGGWGDATDLIPNAAATTPNELGGIAPVMAMIQGLDLKARVAQLMFVTLEGRFAPSSEDRALLEQYTPGAVAVRRLGDPSEAAPYMENLRPVEAATGLPLLVGVDLFSVWQDATGNARYPAPLPSLLSVAAARDAEAARHLADAVVQQFDALGFNLHIGPGLELAPSTPGVRGTLTSLGSDPEFAGAMACAFIEAARDRGAAIMPTGFPGGGANQRGKDPAVLLTPRPLLDQGDLLPYRRAIDEGEAEIIHVGTVLTPTIDPAQPPACLSARVMEDLLREELGFKGVVVAGPMDAAHIGALYDFADAAQLALLSGADMLYWRVGGKRVMRVVDELVQAVDEGRLSEGVVNAALARVLELKRHYALAEREAPKERDARKLKRRQKERAEQAARITRRSITIVQNRGQVLPLSKAHSTPIGVTGVTDLEPLRNRLEKYVKRVPMQIIATAKHVGDITDFEAARVTAHIEGAKTIICVFTDTERVQGQRILLHKLKDKGVRVVVVLLGYPNNLPQFTEADAIVLGYCEPPLYAQTLEAAADVLMGYGPIRILPAEKDLHTRVGKNEIFRTLDVVRCPAGRLPVALGAPFEAGLGLAYPPVDALKKVYWDFGDGDRARVRAKDGYVTVHAFDAPGRYPVTLAIQDAKGGEVEHTYHVVVE